MKNLPTWAVTDVFGEKVLARPVVHNSVAFVAISVDQAMTRDQWDEFKGQVEELMEVAEANNK